MKIDTDIVLWNGNDRKKYKVIITIEATTPIMMVDGSKEEHRVENYDTLQKLLKEFICDYNKKASEAYAHRLQSGESPTQQIGKL